MKKIKLFVWATLSILIVFVFVVAFTYFKENQSHIDYFPAESAISKMIKEYQIKKDDKTYFDKIRLENEYAANLVVLNNWNDSLHYLFIYNYLNKKNLFEYRKNEPGTDYCLMDTLFYQKKEKIPYAWYQFKNGYFEYPIEVTKFSLIDFNKIIKEKKYELLKCLNENCRIYYISEDEIVITYYPLIILYSKGNTSYFVDSFYSPN